MFVRKLRVERTDVEGRTHSCSVAPCPLKWLDSFAMRNFTNDAIFDDTLPIADGLLEAGYRVPIDKLQSAMQDWFRRKGYLKPQEHLWIVEVESHQS